MKIKNLNKMSGNNFLSWLLAAMALITPLIVVPQLNDAFTLPKMLFIRSVLIVIIFVWLLKGVLKGFSWRHSKFDVPVAMFTAAAVLATIFSTDLRLSLFGHYKRYEDIITLVTYSLLFFSGTQILKSDKQRSRIVNALLISAVIVSIYALAQYLGFNFWQHSGDINRASSTLGNPVFLGSYLVLVFPLFWAGLFRITGGKRQWLNLLPLVIVAAAILVTFSRSAWLATIVAAIYFIIVTAKTLWNQRVKVVALVISLFIVAVFVSFVRVPGRNYSFSERTLSALNTGQGTVRTRLILWETTAALINKRPLIGYGPDSLSQQYPKYLPIEYRVIERAARIDKAHNDILQVAATTGLLGVSAYLAIIFIFIYMAFGGADSRTSKDIDRAALTSGLLGYLVAIQFSFSQLEVSALFWLLLAMFATGPSEINQNVPRSLPKYLKRLGVGMAAIWLAVSVWVIIFIIVKPAVADYHFKSGLSAESRQDLSRAQNEYQWAVKFSPNRPVYLSRLARVEHLKAVSEPRVDLKMVKEALRYYDKAQKIDPYDAVLYTDIGSLYTVLGQSNSQFNTLAIAAFKRSLELDPFSAAAYMDIAVAYKQQGDYEKAINALKLALRYGPKSGNAYYNLALIYEEQGRIKLASFSAGKAVKLSPSDKKIRTLQEKLAGQLPSSPKN